MLYRLKRRLYFFVASYFAFWAKIVLKRWNPRIVIVTGSSGKTTVLHLIEAQLGENAIYSHHANSAIGIPFHILGMEPNVPSKAAWLKYLLAAPFHIFRSLPNSKLYIVEADTDRPHEGKFTAKFLKPEVVLWISVYRTHSMNFDKQVRAGLFKTHEEAIAFEFGYFIENATKLVMVNNDQPLMLEQLKRVAKAVKVEAFSIKDVTQYKLSPANTNYQIKNLTINLPGIHPKELGIGLQMVNQLINYLGFTLNPNFPDLKMPPGRSNLLKAKKGVLIIDSTYNTGLKATVALMELFKYYPSEHKWLVVGDILEQGSLEKEEHEQLAEEIIMVKPERIILLGTRTKNYTYPVLSQKLKDVPIVSYTSPAEVLKYLKEQLTGGEVVLFKGVQGLEGVIEDLLEDPKDSEQLVRREPSWIKRRQAWGLPK